jgi:hypothetical protein
MTPHNEPFFGISSDQEERFLNYRMAVVLEMPDSAYKRALLDEMA